MNECLEKLRQNEVEEIYVESINEPDPVDLSSNVKENMEESKEKK